MILTSKWFQHVVEKASVSFHTARSKGRHDYAKSKPHCFLSRRCSLSIYTVKALIYISDSHSTNQAINGTSLTMFVPFIRQPLSQSITQPLNYISSGFPQDFIRLYCRCLTF